MYDIITIGSATQDVFLRSKAWETKEDPRSPTGLNACLPFGSKVPIEDLHFTTGGGATNAAVTFAR
ncbi:MAG: carbohydrate kinase family protein, partial [bacterium]|nr:carbohydrate kinase family protein [bacterium]